MFKGVLHRFQCEAAAFFGDGTALYGKVLDEECDIDPVYLSGAGQH